MSDVFEQLQSQIKESNDRWAEIDDISERLRYVVDQKIYLGEHSTEVNLMMTKLVLLLVDQLKPMSTSGEQVEKLQDDIKNMLGSIVGGK